MTTNECNSCGTTTEDLSFGADPYAAEILGDDTPVWLCRYCYDTRAADI